MLKLYGSAVSRATIVQWYLEELKIPYEFVLLDTAQEEHRQPEYLAINPIGKIPGIVDGDFKLWESGAILLYLAEKYGNQSYSVEKQAQLTQWVMFANATLTPNIFNEGTREQETPRLLTPLNQILGSQPFLLGAEFTVADVAVGSVLFYLQMMLKLDFSAYSAVIDYIQRLAQREAFSKSIGSGS